MSKKSNSASEELSNTKVHISQVPMRVNRFPAFTSMHHLCIHCGKPKPNPDNSGHMQINSRPWHGGQAQWGAGIIKWVLVFLGVADLQAGPDG
jgi:hypothetical protein